MHTSNCHSPKNKIRQLIKQKIINLPLTTKEIATNLIFNKFIILSKTKKFQQLQNFGCYWPQTHEVNILPIIYYLLNNHKSCYLPVINKHERILQFVKYNRTTKLIPNKFGILEPNNCNTNVKNKEHIYNLDLCNNQIYNKSNIYHKDPNDMTSISQINMTDLEVIFMPSIAFNANGNRIGSGLGYYDLTLNTLTKEQLAKIKLIGVLFSQQEFNGLEFNFTPDLWDIDFNYIITEKKIIII